METYRIEHRVVNTGVTVKQPVYQIGHIPVTTTTAPATAASNYPVINRKQGAPLYPVPPAASATATTGVISVVPSAVASAPTREELLAASTTISSPIGQPTHYHQQQQIPRNSLIAPSRPNPPQTSIVAGANGLDESTCAEICTAAPDSVLFVDCRNKLAFQSGHIKGAVNLTFSALLIRRLRKAGKAPQLDDLLVSDTDKFRIRRDPNCVVIAYDDDSYNVMEDSSLALLMELLEAEGVSAVYLKGGYQRFKGCFPALCNESVKPRIPIPERPQQLASPWEPPSKILSFLYMGSRHDATNYKFLQEEEITHILCLTENPSFDKFTKEKYRCHHIPLRDSVNQNILVMFPEAIKFINDAKSKGGKVYVHCEAGISRSSAVVAAYLISECHKSREEALRFLRGARQRAAPNLGFMGQLIRFEASLGRS